MTDASKHFAGPKEEDGVETPSGKGAADENFPVGSWLLPATLRPHVATYYAFARAIDDIADNPALAPEDKIARLSAFEAALSAPGAAAPGLEKATRLRDSLAGTGVPTARGTDLVAAFKQDAVKLRYADWGGATAGCRPIRSDAISWICTAKTRRAMPPPTRCAARCRSSITCRTARTITTP